MKIARLAQRTASVDLDGKIYQFAKDENGQYTAEVDDEKHAFKLLSISGYSQVTKGKEKPVVIQKVDTPDPDADLGDETDIGLHQKQDEAEDGPGSQPDGGKNDDTGETDRDKLVEQYQAKFNRKPHARLSAEKIKQALDEGTV